MSEAIIPKAVNAVLDFPFDWATWLGDGETINSHEVTVPSGITKDSDSKSGGVVTVWLSGGTAGEIYTVACKIATSLSRTIERSIDVYVLERVVETFQKDPSDVLEYPFDWVNHPTGRWLGESETISSHVISADTGITVDSDSESGGIVTAWLSGGTAGTSYDVACKIVTSDGRTDERTIKILVQQR